MSVFRAGNLEWLVRLDAFVLEDVQKSAGVDLADLAAAGWWKVETDAGAAVRALAVVCGDEIRGRGMDSRAFARLLRGPAITEARAALLSEGADFFPPSEWSAILSSLEKRRTNQTAQTGLTTLGPILELLPADMRQDFMTGILAEIHAKASTDLPPSVEGLSATGQGDILSPFATDSAEKLAS